jgi:asparagine synthase (glutamine-hydrolysing)
MSAIYGIINKKGKAIDEQVVNRLSGALLHRCVQGHASVMNENIAFGFCKLGVYARAEAGEIPLQLGTQIITANARLHNRDVLCKKLEVDARLYPQCSDAFLILKAFQKWGSECVQHLEGEYVYAIWDGQTKELFLSIDHIGYKPVYYYDSPDHFIFCSEIKGIEAVKETPNYFNEECLVQFVMYHRDWNGTYNKEIHPLYGGRYLSLKEDTISIQQYWKLQPGGKYRFTKDQDWYDCLYELFYKAVQNRLDTEAKVGISLSGGLDSSAIACVLSDILKKKNKPLFAFSSVLPSSYSGVLQDERDYISIVSKHCGNIVNFYESAEGLSLLDEAEERFEIDEAIPLASQVMNFSILEAARREGVNIFYTGIGGDFWLSAHGHTVINGLIRQNSYQEALKLLLQVRKNKGLSFPQAIKRYILLETIAAHKYYYSKVYWKRRTCLDSRYDNRLKISAKSESEAMLAYVNDCIAGRVMQRMDNRTEFFSMVSANPCFDYRLMEFLADVPLRLFLAGGEHRGLFRKSISRILPKQVAERSDKKMYISDFSQRLKDAAQLLPHLDADEKTMQYFSKERINKLLQDLNTTPETVHYYRTLTVRAWQVLMADRVIKKIIKKSYVF